MSIVNYRKIIFKIKSTRHSLKTNNKNQFTVKTVYHSGFNQRSRFTATVICIYTEREREGELIVCFPLCSLGSWLSSMTKAVVFMPDAVALSPQAGSWDKSWM